MEDCQKLDTAARARYDEIDVMAKCLDAAVANLEISVKQLEPKYVELKKWVTGELEEHKQLANNWEQYLDLAKNTPISPALVKFMTRVEKQKSNPTLLDLIEPETAKKAGKLASTAYRRFSEKAADLDKAAGQMYEGLDGLVSSFNGLMSRSVLTHSGDSSQLLADIEAIVRQIDQDYQNALGFGGTQRDLAQASKTASNHTERLVPNLKKRTKEMDDMVQYATRGRNAIASDCVAFMRKIADITSLHGGVKSQINVLGHSNDDLTTFDYLRLIHQLPYMYASFVVEAIRRQGWVDKVKTDSSTLANEMALFQDEESKRRRKWQKMVGSTYGPNLDTNVMGLEVNLLGEENSWPTVSKDELDRFLDTLKSQETDESVLEDVTKLVQELDAPTKQQSKRLKAFKNGSMHEANLGRSGLMIRGDDDLLRSLQDDKGRLESKLKTAESRVRRLEDLLHRQSQASRPHNLFQPQSPQPNVQSHERRGSSSSAKSPRMGSRHRGSDGADPLLRRIAQLEAELHEEKERSSRFQKDLGSRTSEHGDLKNRLQDITAVKKDLLENMEAQKREFGDERKSLEDEIKLLKARLEDTEDEMEHFGESREHEKASYDERVTILGAEVERLTREAKDASLKAEGQVEFLRKESRLQRERLEVTERDLQSAHDDRQATRKKLEETSATAEAHLETMNKLHRGLAPQSEVPEDEADLYEALVALVEDISVKLRNGETDSSVARTNLDKAQTLIKELRSELHQTHEKLGNEEDITLQLNESLSEEKAKVAALENEVNEGKDHLHQLRAKISDGKAGSETLQKRLEDEEAKITTLTEQLAARQSQVGSLEEELHMFREKHNTVQEKLSNLNDRYESRDEKTKALTQKMYSQNDRLIRLLDRMGYAVSRVDGTTTITKVPRAERTSQNPNDSSDPGSSIRKSISLGGKGLSESADLGLLYWMNDSDMAAEDENYQAFMNSLGHFDVDQFTDTVYYRLKETEHKARKWQRDARGYRDRAHVAQKDAHEKIAFRHFKEGDLALFLPTRNQQAGAWAAFNVGFPHYFLREQDGHKLRQREWLVARISRIQERVVDLSKSLEGDAGDADKDEEDDNPFQLSDGLRWYLLDANEDKAGAPSTPGMGKSTVAATTVEATANIHTHAAKGKNRDSVASIEGINKTLSKSLESRRSSSSSKKALPFAVGGASQARGSALASETNSLRAAAPETPMGTSPTSHGLGINKVIHGQGHSRKTSEATNSIQQGTSEGGLEQGQGSAGKSTTTSEVRNLDNLLGP